MALGKSLKDPLTKALLAQALTRCRIKTDPAGYIRDRFPYKLWYMQEEIIQSVFHHKYTTVKACHASSKTFTASLIVPVYLEAFCPAKVLTTAPTNYQVENLLWAEINTIMRDNKMAFPSYWNLLNKRLFIAPDRFAIGMSSDDDVNYQGLHCTNFLFIGDESSGIANARFNAIETLLTSVNSKMLLIGNPDAVSGYFYDSFKNPRFNKFTISAFDTPNFEFFGITIDDIRSGEWQEIIADNPTPYPALISPEWVYDAYIRWGEDSPLFVAKVLGEFPSQAVDTLIPLSYIEAAQRRTLSPKGERQWGLDVAAMGTDRTVLMYRRGGRLEKTWVFTKFDEVQVSEWCAKIIKEVDCSALVVVDAAGIGSGVASMLKRQHSLNVYRYTGSGKALDNDTNNERSSMFWHLRQLFRSGTIAGNIDEATKEELTAIKYTFQQSKVVVEPKEKLKARLGKSPDLADAIMMCFAPIQQINRDMAAQLIIPVPDRNRTPDGGIFVPISSL